jgi:hypothetical protein
MTPMGVIFRSAFTPALNANSGTSCQDATDDRGNDTICLIGMAQLVLAPYWLCGMRKVSPVSK